MAVRVIVAFVFYFLISACTYAQSDTTMVLISGTVVGNDATLPVVNVMVVDKKTGQGIFGKADNTFSISIQKRDTLLITAAGYSVKKICFNDSIWKDKYVVTIKLEKPFVNLKPVTIISQREIENIQKDIEKLGYKKEDYMLTGIDAFESPITFLYQQFSRRERAKREIAERINEDKKRALLKELFRKYVDGQIMDLTEEEFDDFTAFINVSDDFLKTSGQYDFIIFVKRKFEIYRALKK